MYNIRASQLRIVVNSIIMFKIRLYIKNIMKLSTFDLVIIIIVYFIYVIF